MLAVLLLLTPLHSLVSSNMPYAVFYLCFILGFGLLAVCIQKPFIVLSTSFGGMLAFLLGVLMLWYWSICACEIVLLLK